MNPVRPDPAQRRRLLARAFAAPLATAFAGLGAGPWPLRARAAVEAVAATQPLWRSRFEHGLADWRGLTGLWGADNQHFFTEAGVAGQVLRVHIRQGSIDPGSMLRRGLPRAGTGFKARVLAPGLDSAVLRYRLRFAPGFDFVRGGKLPGLLGGNGPSGGRMPNGQDGFSLRLMWRERGQGEVYAYLPTSQRHGTSLLRGRWQFEPGRWHEVVQAVALNTPGRDDGRVQMWLDGRLAGQADGLRLRDVAILRLDGVFFDVFFGGNDDSWAARADTHVDFADFVVHGGDAPGALPAAPSGVRP
jgi:hypothetical protein